MMLLWFRGWASNAGRATIGSGSCRRTVLRGRRTGTVGGIAACFALNLLDVSMNYIIVINK